MRELYDKIDRLDRRRVRAAGKSEQANIQRQLTALLARGVTGYAKPSVRRRRGYESIGRARTAENVRGLHTVRTVDGLGKDTRVRTHPRVHRTMARSLSALSF